ncbi:MAG: HAMP domain-containing histidine kinase [Sulfurimonas sp.]|nr:HAMP domain-containing histidine kinase [Sulfurimonas sp.]
MGARLDKFFTSGWNFDETELELRSKFQMMNVAIILSSLGLIYGITVNIIREIPNLISLELFLLSINVILLFILRYYRNSFNYVSLIITVQFTFLFLFLIYSSEPSALKHVWIYTYPIILLYLQNKMDAIYWVITTIFFLLMAPLQPFVEVSYSLFQVSYIAVVLVIMSVIVQFYKLKMDEARGLVVSQQLLLKKQIEELTQKDQLLSTQSKQAVMGEMIEMIAHQWRQPLSTVTLSVSNLQVKKLLGDKIDDAALDKALEDISDTVVYLSSTIDDFQTYFRPIKELSDIEVHELIQKAVNFVLPRLKNTKIYIEIENENEKEIHLKTYLNELIQIILNIVNNAIDALVITNVQNPHIVISIEEKKESVVIIIKDNAGGIKEEDVARIFEPYYSTKGKNGTGLGLYMSQMLVQKQFNGNIDVISSNKGSYFSVEIDKVLT